MPFFSSLFGGNSSNSRSSHQPSSQTRLTKPRSPLAPASAPRPTMSARSSYEQPVFKPVSKRTHSFGSSSGHSSHISFAGPGPGSSATHLPCGHPVNELGARKHVTFVTPGGVNITSSNSSSSLYSLPGAPGVRGRYADPRPVLRERNMSWSGPVASPGAPLKLHHTIAYARRRPVIAYDILHAPNHTNVLDPTTNKPISSHALNLPATSPPATELKLTSPYLPWPIIVTSSTSPEHAITNLDVLQAVHTALRIPVSRQEWEALGNGSKTQRRVADAYESRCHECGGDWNNGVRRSDWLDGRTIFYGIEGQAGGSYKLMMGR